MDEKIIQAAEYWRSGEGFNKKSNKTIDSLYFNNFAKLIRTEYLIGLIKKENIALNENTPVIEMGCAVARNLFHIHNEFGCDVIGYDVNERAIKRAREIIPRGRFCVLSLTENLDIFEAMERNMHYKLGITMGFLMHVPVSKVKKRLINTFLNMCEFNIMIELSDNCPEYTNGCALTGENYCDYNSQIKYIETITGSLNVYIKKDVQ